MGKKGKGKKPKGKKAEDSDLPELYFGTGTFKFPNGDLYEGEYGAHRIGIIWREGQGKYTTHDGQVYESIWKDDKLSEDTDVTINYSNGAKYEGKVSKNKYSGPGTYTLESDMMVSCQFRENKPIEEVTLIDVDGNLWVGTAEKDGVLLLPENIFYLNISDDRGKGQLKKEETEPIVATEELDSQEEEHQSITSKELEQQVFAKSLKTRDSLNFDDSIWFKRYTTFIQKRRNINAKIQSDGIESLDGQEKKWLEKYERFKKREKLAEENRKKALTNKSEVDLTLLEKFYSKEYRESCPAVKVFHPTSDWFPGYLATTKDQETEQAEEDETEIPLSTDK